MVPGTQAESRTSASAPWEAAGCADQASRKGRPARHKRRRYAKLIQDSMQKLQHDLDYPYMEAILRLNEAHPIEPTVKAAI
eukprot:13100440-Heterocapsa_arctica.AAC.1